MIIKRKIKTTQLKTRKEFKTFLDRTIVTLWGLPLPVNPLNRLQKSQNAAAAPIVTRTNYREHVTPVLQSLHWLPISKRVEYKIPFLICLCVHETAPQYICQNWFLHTVLHLVLSAPLPNADKARLDSMRTQTESTRA